MLPFVIISIVVLTAVLSLHYHRHFKFRLRCTNPESTRRFSATHADSASSGDDSGWSAAFNSNRKSSTKARPSAIDAVHDFLQDATNYRCMFTSSTDQEFDFFPITYFLYLSFLIIVCVVIIVRCFMIDSYINIASNTFNPSLPPQHTMHMAHITDWILVYCILVISLWESLFSFYRYYLTDQTTKSFAEPHMLKVFLIFSVYILIYSACYVAFIHYNYWFFAGILLIHFTFNTLCNFKFAAILIKTYSLFISMETSQQNINLNKSILYSVYFMRRTSFICTILQSLYISLFAIFYTINIVYFIPILWTLSAMIFTLNFVRNREYINEITFKHRKLCCFCIFIHKTSTKLSQRTRNRSKGSKSKSNRKGTGSVRKGTGSMRKGTGSNRKGTESIRKEMESKRKQSDDKYVAHIQTPENVTNLNIPAPDKDAKMRAFDELQIDTSNEILEVIHDDKDGFPAASPSVPSLLARESVVPLPQKQPAMQLSQSANFIHVQPQHPLKGKAFDILGLTPLQPYNLTVDKLVIEDDEIYLDVFEVEDDFECTMINRPTPQPTPQGTPSGATMMMVDVSQAQYSLNIPTPVAEKEEADVAFDVCQEDEQKVAEANEMKVDQLNLDEVVRSLNVLVNHGFCSIQTVNNVKEISRYIHKRR